MAPSRRKVNEAELTDALRELPGWIVQDGKLHKTFKFASFAAAMGWMVTIAIAADKLDHHPEWCNVYNRVTVNLITHDLNSLSTWDLILARKMEAAATIPT